MKSLKEFISQINEVLKPSDPIEKWIDDFVHSKNPKFASKTKAERIEMAKGAYYGAQKNESVNEAKEEHLVHVSDGSKYDEVPHPKDIEHVKTGAMHHGGQWAGHSDKGAFFKFKSKEDAEHFKRHVDKCPHKTCYADLSEAVEYKGIGTDVVDKKKVLNPPIPLTQKKKEVKDFKEGYDHGPIDRDAKVAVGHKAAVLAGSGLDSGKHGTVVGSSSSRTGDMWHIKTASGDIVKMHKHRVAKLKESVELIAKHEVKADAPHKSGGHVILTKSSDKWHVLHNKKSNPSVKDLHNSKLLHSYDGEKEAWSKFKELHEDIKKEYDSLKKHDIGTLRGIIKQQHKIIDTSEFRTKEHAISHILNNKHGNKRVMAALGEETINELSKKTLGSYVNKAAKDSRYMGQIATDFENQGDKARKQSKKDSFERLHRKYLSKSWKRETGIAKAVDKLTKEETITELSKKTLANYVNKAAHDAASGAYQGKEYTAQSLQHTAASDWDASKKKHDLANKEFARANKRLVNIPKATTKMAKEEVQIDELNKSTYQSYRDKAGKDVDRAYDIHQNPYKKTDKDDMRKLSNRVKGDERAERSLKEEQIEEATVSTRKYDWGTMKTVNHGKSFSIPLHPEHHEPIAKLKHGESHSFKDETGRKWKATRDNDTVHFHGGSYGTQKTSVPHKSLAEAYTDKQYQTAIAAYLKKGGKVETLPTRKPRPSEKTFINRTGSIWKKGYTKSAVSGFNSKSQTSVDDRNKHIREEAVEESRGHKVLATFFKNREVAQKAFNGDKQTPKYLEKGIETPEKDAVEKKKMMGMKEAFLSKSEEDDMKNLDAYTFYKKYGRNKAKHRASHATKTSDVEKYTEETVVEGHDDYAAIAKELVKKHGKNVTKAHITDFEGQRDSNRSLDHAEVMHHVKKLNEVDMPHDETWTKFDSKKHSTKGAK